MTGTERAALRLALGTLRSLSAKRVAQAAVLYACDALAFMPDNAIGDAAVAAYGNVPARLLRARLALLLRTVLRADGGTIGHATKEREQWEAWTHGAEHWFGYVCRGWSGIEFASAAWSTTDRYERVRLAVPLWSQAPTRLTP